uniref:Uncharacterized protein n=1 Tax=Myotis myotis TaxID=51298 RepID=A0A7J7ZYI4_MYOMY|nr:hypothetical protein mMyoMyo1_010011 [Myotis myotis]
MPGRRQPHWPAWLPPPSGAWTPGGQGQGSGLQGGTAVTSGRAGPREAVGCGCWGCPGSVSQPREDIRGVAVIVTHRAWLPRKGWGCTAISPARPPARDELPDFLPLVSRAELVSFAQCLAACLRGTGRVSLRSRQEGRSVLGLKEDTLSPDSSGRGTVYRGPGTRGGRCQRFRALAPQGLREPRSQSAEARVPSRSRDPQALGAFLPAGGAFLRSEGGCVFSSPLRFTWHEAQLTSDQTTGKTATTEISVDTEQQEAEDP